MFSHLCFLCLLDDDANNLIGRDRDECECAVTMYAKADTIWLLLSDMSCSSSFSSLMRNHWQLARDPFRLALSRMCRPFTSNGFVIILISRILFFVSSFVERAPIISSLSAHLNLFIFFFLHAYSFVYCLYTHIFWTCSIHSSAPDFSFKLLIDPSISIQLCGDFNRTYHTIRSFMVMMRSHTCVSDSMERAKQTKKCILKWSLNRQFYSWFDRVEIFSRNAKRRNIIQMCIRVELRVDVR